MHRLRAGVLLVALLSIAFVPLACDSAGITGAGGCDADVIPPTTYGRQYEKDWNKCAGSGLFDFPNR